MFSPLPKQAILAALPEHRLRHASLYLTHTACALKSLETCQKFGSLSRAADFRPQVLRKGGASPHPRSNFTDNVTFHEFVMTIGKENLNHATQSHHGYGYLELAWSPIQAGW